MGAGGYQETFLETQTRVRISHGKRAIGVRVIEVLLYIVRLKYYKGMYVMCICSALNMFLGSEGIEIIDVCLSWNLSQLMDS